ncbi:MAG: hypothetical protein ACXIVE_14565 [Salinarimonas sp.]
MSMPSAETGATPPGIKPTGNPGPETGASERVRDAHPRHRRLGALLRGACEDPQTLVAVLGQERIAVLLNLPESAVIAMTNGRPALRRRFATLLRRRIGLTRLQVAAARELPDDLRELVYGIYLFATTLRLADTPRILPRERMRALAASYGEEPLSFALAQRALLRDSAQALREVVTGEPPSETDQRLFIRALAAHGHPAAACIALMLGLPVSLATRDVENRFDAVITGLPTLAARALAHIHEKGAPPLPGPDWRQNAAAGTDSDSIARQEDEWRRDADAEAAENTLAESAPPAAPASGDRNDDRSVA